MAKSYKYAIIDKRGIVTSQHSTYKMAVTKALHDSFYTKEKIGIATLNDSMVTEILAQRYTVFEYIDVIRKSPYTDLS